MINPEVSCQNCRAACCKGVPFLTMQLSPEELAFMKAGGNILQTIETPVDYDREDVLYPISANIDPARETIQWLCKKGHETEPLPAGMGRYAMVGACKYLEMDEDGVEICSVYSERPQVCHNFEMGSTACLQTREIQGIPLPMPNVRKSTYRLPGL